jgi:hypothetical protein
MNTRKALTLRKNLWSKLLLAEGKKQFISETAPCSISKTKPESGNPKTITTQKDEKIIFLVQEALNRKTGI